MLIQYIFVLTKRRGRISGDAAAEDGSILLRSVSTGEQSTSSFGIMKLFSCTNQGQHILCESDLPSHKAEGTTIKQKSILRNNTKHSSTPTYDVTFVSQKDEDSVEIAAKNYNPNHIVYEHKPVESIDSESRESSQNETQLSDEIEIELSDPSKSSKDSSNKSVEAVTALSVNGSDTSTSASQHTSVSRQLPSVSEISLNTNYDIRRQKEEIYQMTGKRHSSARRWRQYRQNVLNKSLPENEKHCIIDEFSTAI